MKYLTLLLVLLFQNTALAAGDIDRGRELAQHCVGCHGTDGISPVNSNPNLAGQKSEYLQYALRAYRDGVRKGGLAFIMQANASGLSDQDIDDLVLFFSSLPAAGTAR